MLPEVFKSNVIVSLVKQAVPDYVVKLIDIKHIRAWPDEVRAYTRKYTRKDSIRSLDI